MLPTTPPSVTEIIRTRDAWRSRLERESAATARRLGAAYARTLPALEAQLGALVADIDALETRSTEGVRGLRTFGRLYRQIEAEMDDFARLARNEAGLLSEAAAGHGANGARALALAQVGPLRGALGAAWIEPDPAALARLAGLVDGEAMRARVARFGASAADSFADTLLALTAQGKPPVAIARALTQWFQFPRAWAETHARTAQLTAYRQASHAAYQANARVVEGWLWWASIGDPRTCLSCVSQHGSLHPVTETLNDHHRGRCSPLPVVRGAQWARSVETGPAWFAAQPSAMQRQLMGPGMFDAYRRGEVDVADLSRTYTDGVYGEMLRTATLKELGVRRRPLTRP